jgi:hypothetical protein
MFQRLWHVVPVALGSLLASLAIALPASAAPTVPLLVDVRAAHHENYDRLVFEFSGDQPARRSVQFVDQVVDAWTGNPVPVVGNAFLSVWFAPAVGHDAAGQFTYGAKRRAYALPNLMQVVNTSDYEGILGFGIGLAVERPITVFSLTSPTRMVIDIDTSFATVQVDDYFIQGGSLDPVAVSREVVPPATAKGALQRLFAGPTAAELGAGLTFVNSEATGFNNLGISAGIARVTLTGGCDSHGSTTTIADEIVPTLKQFTSVQWVKIYDPSGQTERPTGNTDSIPFCLEP